MEDTWPYGALRVSLYRSEIDGAVVVQIDTDDEPENYPLRIRVNDDTAWEARHG